MIILLILLNLVLHPLLVIKFVHVLRCHESKSIAEKRASKFFKRKRKATTNEEVMLLGLGTGIFFREGKDHPEELDLELNQKIQEPSTRMRIYETDFDRVIRRD